MKKILLGILFGVSCTLFGQKADLKITIKGIKTEKGKLLISLFDSKKDFPKGKAYKKVLISPQAESLTYTFENVVNGKYAVAVLHDENSNGKMDIGMFGPKELYAFSNNVRGLFSPPKFDKASFLMNGENKTMILNLK